MMNEHTTPGISGRELCRILLRRKKRVLSLAALILCLTAAVIVYYPRTYSSEARLFVRVGREIVALDPTATQGQTTNIQKSYKQEINSILEIVNSRSIAEKVVASIGVERLLGSGEPKTAFKRLIWQIKEPVRNLDPISDEERAIIAVREWTSFFVPKDSGIITITCKADSPKIAQEIVASTLEAFRAEHVRVSRTRGSQRFFTQQTGKQLQHLEEVSRELRDAKNQNGIVTFEGQRALLMDQIGQVEKATIETNNALAYSEARAKDLQMTVDRLPKTIVREVESGIGHRSTDQMRQQLYALEIQERHHTANYTKDHPTLLAVQEQRKKVEDIFKDQPRQRAHTTEGVNDSREELRVQLLVERATLAALRAKANSLADEHARLDAERRKLNDREMQFAKMRRNVELAESHYQKYSGNLEQARIDQALEDESISSVNTIQPASYSERPTSPRKTLVVLLGLLLAVACPLALALGAEYFDHTFTTPSQVEDQLGLPVLVSIPRTSAHRVSLN